MVGKDKGKQGNVTAFIKELNAIFVSGLNTVKHHFSILLIVNYVELHRKSNE